MYHGINQVIPLWAQVSLAVGNFNLISATQNPINNRMYSAMDFA
jgi:hypothetical protein